MDIADDTCLVLAGKMAFPATGIVQNRCLTVSALPLVASQTISFIEITGKILFAMGFDLNRRQPRHNPRITELGRVTWAAGFCKVDRVYRGIRIRLIHYGVSCVTVMAFGTYFHALGVHPVAVLLIMACTAIHLLRTSMLHVGVGHNARVTVRAGDFLIMDRMLIGRLVYGSYTLAAPFAMATKAIDLFIREARGCKN